MRSFVPSRLASLIFMLLVSACSAQVVTDVYNFSTASPPQWLTLTQGRDGKLYGDTFDAMFRLGTNGTYSEFYKFPYGIHPYGGVILATDGNYYGTLENGGSLSLGALFKISPSGVYTELYDFSRGADGVAPMTPPTEGEHSNFYGTTAGDTLGDAWTVYRYTQSGIFTTIYSVSQSQYFVSPVIQSTGGNLYGTTEIGGANNCGTIFELSTDGNLLFNYNFPCDSGGGYPFAPLVQANDGNFYGTTNLGGAGYGTVFKMTPAGVVSTLYAFLGPPSDGAYPTAGLLQATDGYLYGSTTNGGSTGCGSLMPGCGTLFRISTSGNYQLLYAFPQSIGQLPSATMMQHTNGILYLTTLDGGTHFFGSVVSLDMGLAPFVALLPVTGKTGQTVQILGQQLTGTTRVAFNGVPSESVSVISDTFIMAVVPPQAITGTVVVSTPNATFKSNKPFRVME